MFQSTRRLRQGLVKLSSVASLAVVTLVSSSTWAAVAVGGVVYSPPEKRSFGGFTSEYVEYNGESISDNSSAAANINFSHRALIVGHSSGTKPVAESHVAAYSQATWNKGANRTPSVQTFTYHTLFGQSLPTVNGVDQSTATTLASSLSSSKSLTQNYQFMRVSVPIYGPVVLTALAGVEGSVGVGATARASTNKGTAEKSYYSSSSGLSGSGSIKLWNKDYLGDEKLASIGFRAEFVLANFGAKFGGGNELDHRAHNDVRRGYGLEGEYTLSAGAGKVQLVWTFLPIFFGGASGTTDIVSWPALASFTHKWANYPIIIMGDAGDAW